MITLKISKDQKTYIAIGVLFTLSILLYVSEMFVDFQWVWVVSTTSSIVMCILKFVIDQLKAYVGFLYEKQKIAYATSISSDAISRCYSAYFDFAEEYIEKIYEITKLMYKNGTRPEIYNYGLELRDIRRRRVLYIPKDINNKLIKFEKVLHIIGAESEYQQHTIGLNDDSEQLLRKESIRKTHDLFKIIMDVTDEKGSEYIEVQSAEEIIAILIDDIGPEKIFKTKDSLFEI